MITPYTHPQQTITQILRATPAVAFNRTNALAIGVQYLLALADGRELPEAAFVAAGSALPYRYLENGVAVSVDAATHKVKADSVKLFGADLEAIVATTTALEYVPGNLSALRLPPTGSDNLAGPSGLLAALSDRQVQVGDKVAIRVDNVTAGAYVTADQTFYRTVTGLTARTVASTVNASSSAAGVASTANVGNAAANATLAVADVTAPGSYSILAANVTINGSASKFFEVGGRFNGKLGEEITLTCTTGGANNVAQFLVAYSALGETEAVTSAAGAGGTEFVLTLTKYNGSTVKIVITGSAAVAGQVARFKVFPIHANNAAAAFRVDDASAYTGTADTTYVVEVVKGINNASGTVTGAVLRIYDTQGIEPPVTHTATGTNFPASLPLGTRGLTVTFDSAFVGNPDLATGDKFLFNAVAAGPSATLFDGVTLDGPVYDPALFDVASGKFSVDVRVAYTGEITADNVQAGEPYTVADDELTYPAGLGIVTTRTSVPFCPFVNGRGNLQVSFKASVKVSASERPIKIRANSDIAANFGEHAIENDLAFGVYCARNGAQGLDIYALRVEEDTVEAWTEALDRIKSTDIYYSLAVLTDNEEVMQLVTTHVEDMSSPRNQRFRRCYVGTDSPGAYVLWGALTGGGYRKATLTGDLVTIDAADRAVSNAITANVRKGDKIDFFSLSDDLEVVSVVSPYEFRVLNPNGHSISVASAFTLVKPDTAENTIDFVANRSKVLSSRRTVNVWSDRPTTFINGAQVVVPAKFIAAEIAGLRSALLPQQGLTLTEIETVTEAPSMYARFTPDQLDRAAQNGTMVVSQEIEGGVMFIRHQLTTETSNGALQWEDNPGVIVDVFSYQVKDAFKGYIGKKNVVAKTVDDIRAGLKQLAINATQATLPQFEDIGPMVISFADEDGKEGEVTVRRDSELADSLLTYVKLRIPLPLNGLHNYIDAEMAVTL